MGRPALGFVASLVASRACRDEAPPPATPPVHTSETKAAAEAEAKAEPPPVEATIPVVARPKWAARPTTIDAGDDFACAIDAHARVLCWGDQQLGQCGVVDDEHDTAPVVVAGIDGAVELAVGHQHACARDDKGAVTCWGRSGDEALPAPVRVEAAAGAVGLSAGTGRTCGVRAVGAGRGLVCWRNLAPTTLDTPPFGDPVRVAVAWDEQTYAIDATGTVIAAPRIAGGRPAAVLELPASIDVRAGDYFDCALTREGAVSCWGWFGQDQIGDERDGHFVAAPMSTLSKVSALAVGAMGACVVLESGQVKCWGDPEGDFGPAGAAPATIEGVPAAEEVAVGRDFACARTRSDEVWCWGRPLFAVEDPPATTVPAAAGPAVRLSLPPAP